MKENDRSRTEQQPKQEPTCNVSQKYNFTVGGLALIAGGVIAYLVYRYVVPH